MRYSKKGLSLLVPSRSDLTGEVAKAHGKNFHERFSE